MNPLLAHHPHHHPLCGIFKTLAWIYTSLVSGFEAKFSNFFVEGECSARVLGAPYVPSECIIVFVYWPLLVHCLSNCVFNYGWVGRTLHYTLIFTEGSSGRGYSPQKGVGVWTILIFTHLYGCHSQFLQGDVLKQVAKSLRNISTMV